MAEAVFKKYDTNWSGYLEEEQQNQVAMQVWKYLEQSDNMGYTAAVKRGGGAGADLEYAKEFLDFKCDGRISKDELTKAFVRMLENCANAKKTGTWNKRNK